MKMYKLVITTLIVVLHVSMSTAQAGQGLVPNSMTPAELWNPFSWYYPYGIAAANAWSQYLQNAQAATNQLYQHIQTLSNPPKTPPSNPSQQPTTTNSPEESKPTTTTPPQTSSTSQS